MICLEDFLGKSNLAAGAQVERLKIIISRYRSATSDAADNQGDNGVDDITLGAIDWEEVNRTEDSNYTLIDTSWFIPNDYYIEFKLESNNQVRTYDDIIQFEIVSEKDWCVRGLK